MADKAEKTTKGHCPECGGRRLANVVAEHQRRSEDEDSVVWAETDYRILQCRGCETVYYQQESIFSEDWDIRTDPATGKEEYYIPSKISYWPAPSKRSLPEWTFELGGVDRDLKFLVDDIYVALNNDLRVLAAIGMRTALDRASELLGVDPALTFARKLEGLRQNEKIGNAELETLAVLTDAGSAAAHRGWRPKPDELATMMSILETFFYRTFILGKEAKKLKASVPDRQKY